MVYTGVVILQSPLLLAVRLYWGWQFVQTGWGKMHNIVEITGFFASLNIPFPSAQCALRLQGWSSLGASC